LHIQQKGYASAFEKVQNKTFIAHYTLYTSLSFTPQKPLSIVVKPVKQKIIFFSFPEERHPVVLLPTLFFRYCELPEERHPCRFKICLFLVDGDVNLPEKRHPVVYKSEV